MIRAKNIITIFKKIKLMSKFFLFPVLFFISILITDCDFFL